MKKFLKGLGAILLALVLVTGGFLAGKHVQENSETSAMPKRTIDNGQPAIPPAVSASPGETAMPQPPAEVAPAKEEGVNERVITKSSQSSVDGGWTEVKAATNTTSSEKLALYTSAQKDGDEFIWDDTQKWVVELNDGKGGYYTLYDKQVSNGTVYFEVAQRENGEKLVYVYTVTGSGISVNQYTRTDTGFTEKNVFNSGSVNRTFSSFPNY